MKLLDAVYDTLSRFMRKPLTPPHVRRTPRCDQPIDGWHCILPRGHDGACYAVPELERDTKPSWKR